MDDQGSNAALGKSFKPAPESQLRSHAAILTVVDVASEQEEGRFLVDAELNK